MTDSQCVPERLRNQCDHVSQAQVEAYDIDPDDFKEHQNLLDLQLSQLVAGASNSISANATPSSAFSSGSGLFKRPCSSGEPQTFGFAFATAPKRKLDFQGTRQIVGTPGQQESNAALSHLITSNPAKLYKHVERDSASRPSKFVEGNQSIDETKSKAPEPIDVANISRNVHQTGDSKYSEDKHADPKRPGSATTTLSPPPVNLHPSQSTTQHRANSSNQDGTIAVQQKQTRSVNKHDKHSEQRGTLQEPIVPELLVQPPTNKIEVRAKTDWVRTCLPGSPKLQHSLPSGLRSCPSTKFDSPDGIAVQSRSLLGPHANPPTKDRFPAAITVSHKVHKPKSKLKARPKSSTRPQSGSSYTSVDIIKILGHKLEQEHQQAVEEAAYDNERQQVIQNMHTSFENQQQQLELAHQDNTHLSKALQDIKIKLQQFAATGRTMQKFVDGLGPEVHRLKTEHNQSKDEYLLNKETIKQSQMDREELGKCIASALQKSQQVRGQYNQIFLETQSHLNLMTHRKEDLEQKLGDQAGLLAAERDRTMRLEQQLKATLEMYGNIVGLVQSSESRIIDEVTLVQASIEARGLEDENNTKLDDSLKLLRTLDCAGLITQNAIEKVNDTLQSLHASMSVHFTASEKSCVNIFADGNPMELRLQAQFIDLKSGLITCQALQDHIAQLQKSNASLRESNSTRETSIAELSRARDELQTTKTFLEDRVMKLDVELRVLRDTPVVDLHAAAQQREAETKAAALRDEVAKLKAELEAEGERRRDQNEIEEGLRNEAETLRRELREVQGRIADFDVVKAEMEAKAFEERTKILVSTQKAANRLQADRNMEHENKMHQVRQSKVKTEQKLTEALSELEVGRGELQSLRDQLQPNQTDLQMLREQQVTQEATINELREKIKAAARARQVAEAYHVQCCKDADVARISLQEKSNTEVAALLERIEIAKVTISDQNLNIENIRQSAETAVKDVQDKADQKLNEEFQQLLLAKAEIEDTRHKLQASAEKQKLCSAPVPADGRHELSRSNEDPGEANITTVKKSLRKVNRNICSVKVDVKPISPVPSLTGSPTGQVKVLRSDSQLDTQICSQSQSSLEIFADPDVIYPEAIRMIDQKDTIPETQCFSVPIMTLSQINGRPETSKCAGANPSSSPSSEIENVSSLSPYGDHALAPISNNTPIGRPGVRHTSSHSSYEQLMASLDEDGLETSLRKGHVAPNTASKMSHGKHMMKERMLMRHDTDELQQPTPHVRGKITAAVRFVGTGYPESRTSSISSPGFVQRGPMGSHKITTYHPMAPTSLVSRQSVTQRSQTSIVPRGSLKRRGPILQDSMPQSSKRVKTGQAGLSQNAISERTGSQNSHLTSQSQACSVIVSRPEGQVEPPLPSQYLSQTHMRTSNGLLGGTPVMKSTSIKTTQRRGSNKSASTRYNLRFAEVLDKS